jgi:hypothetical protein
MEIPRQKTIDQYLIGREMDDEQKEKAVLAITKIVYDRNQNVIKAEVENDDEKKKQFLNSVREYDEIIEGKIGEALDGKKIENYDF